METMVSMLLAGIILSALVGGYLGGINNAESSGYALAAQSLALQSYEQMRAARWDAVSFPNVDEVQASNFPPRITVMDIPQSGTNRVYATNFTSITLISTNPLLKLIRIDCVYNFLGRRLCTNTFVSYRATETGQQNVFPAPSPPPATPPPANTGTIPKANQRGRWGRWNLNGGNN